MDAIANAESPRQLAQSRFLRSQSREYDAAIRQLDRAFFGAGHPWGRPTIGTPETVERLTFAQVTEFLTTNSLLCTTAGLLGKIIPPATAFKLTLSLYLIGIPLATLSTAPLVVKKRRASPLKQAIAGRSRRLRRRTAS